MRRILSILLTVILGLGPANALAFASGSNQDDSHLPACCRRNGVHHCAMNGLAQTQGRSSASTNNSETTVSAANCCPCMPRALASTVTQVHAVLRAANGNAQLLAYWRSPQSAETAARISEQRTWPKRGPPALKLL